MKPAPTSHTILCNVAQQVAVVLDLPPEGLVDTVVIPRAHLRRWLELVHSAVMLLDAPLAAARGLRAVAAGGRRLGARLARRLGAFVTTLGSAPRLPLFRKGTTMITLEEQLAEAKRELALRRSCYPQWVSRAPHR